MRVVYLTLDGVMQPLGSSQVLAYLRGLRELGHEFSLVSLEREVDTSSPDRLASMAETMDEAGIDWRWDNYSEGSKPTDIGKNLATAFALVADVVADGDAEAVHARSYLSALVALSIRTLLGTPYIFDFRGFWIDERVDDGRWFTRPAAYRAAKGIERLLYERASGIVSLTNPAADELRNGTLADLGTIPLSVIPTCTDFEAFRRDTPVTAPEVVATAEELSDKLVIGYIGAINGAYCVDESLDLFNEIARLRPDAHLLCLTRQIDEMWRCVEEAGVERTRVTVKSAQYTQMPQWIQLLDWGLVMRRTTFANRAAMPTKLAEFLATGVRPIQYGCNDEVRSWVERTGTGVVLETLDPAEIRLAAQFIATSSIDDDALERARGLARDHFGLESGTLSYDRLYTQMARDFRR